MAWTAIFQLIWPINKLLLISINWKPLKPACPLPQQKVVLSCVFQGVFVRLIQVSLVSQCTARAMLCVYRRGRSGATLAAAVLRACGGWYGCQLAIAGHRELRGRVCLMRSNWMCYFLEETNVKRKESFDGWLYIYICLIIFIYTRMNWLHVYTYIYICLHFSYDIFIITYWYHFSWHRFMHSTWMTCTMQHTVVVQKIRKELSNWCAQAREQNAIL